MKQLTLYLTLNGRLNGINDTTQDMRGCTIQWQQDRMSNVYSNRSGIGDGIKAFKGNEM